MKKFTVEFTYFGTFRRIYKECRTYEEADELASTIVRNGDAYDVKVIFEDENGNQITFNK